MEARSRAQRIEDVVIGLILIGAGGLWTLIWGGMALLASAFGGEAFGWVIIAAALAVGIFVFFLGISFVRGSPSFGGIVRFGTIGLVVSLVLVVALVQARSGKQSNSESSYGDPSGGRGHPAVSRDGKWLAFSGKGIYVARLGAVARRITDSGEGTDAYPEWSPDGSRIVFTRWGRGATDPGMLYVVNRDGSRLRRLTKGDDTAPSWSPDGRAIVFTRAEGSYGLDDNVRVIDSDGKNLRVLIRDAQDPAWSPDGSKIAFARGLGGDIAIFDLKTKRITWVVRSKLSASPAWSPDGRRIAFEDYSDVPSDTPYVIGIPEIYVVNVDGTGLRRLTKDKETDWTPTWTPEGRIIFASFREGPLRLYAMNGHGTGVRRFVIEREKKSH